MDTSDWVTAAISIGALGVAIWSYVGARKQAKRSADAAEASVKLQRAQAEKYEPNWLLAHSHGDTYTITNDCGERCDLIEVSSPALADPRVPETLEHGEGGTFMARNAYGLDRVLTVSWRRADRDDRWERKYPIPGRPPKPTKPRR